MFAIRCLFTFSIITVLATLGVHTADPPGTEPKGTAPKGKPNRLAQEVSPYLLQHAHNPVDWYPWGADAFAKAKKENKLVFLSIGYSACHWCHVMERESFSNPAIADLLNKHFVCVKVDREERPDVDEVYMTALQSLNQSGGWPLSMFLTAEAKPIFGGTYWPPEDRDIDGEKAPGFKTVLKRVMELLEKDRDGIMKQADKVAEITTESMERNTRAIPIIKLDREIVTSAADAYEFDPEQGGFGMKLRGFRGTKFPRASALLFLLHQSTKPGQEALAKSVKLTLEKMAMGGIYDQLGGGFHRYSTERTWTVPHFEKMLYDNAQLLELYSEARRITGDKVYDPIITGTANFVAHELTSPDGVFYSALDADSEGKEGTFYIWTAKQLEEVLGDTADAKKLKAQLSFDAKPNFEEKFYIPRLQNPLSPDSPEITALKTKLFDVRAKRERPFLDTKILTGWNGQMIAGYAKAGEVLKEPKYIQAAEKAAGFLLSTMRTKDGRLLRIYAAKSGEKPQPRGPAFLDDYAFLVHGLLNLHDATKNERWLTEAKAITDQMLKWHGDPDRGGFYITANDAEKLFARGKDYYDSAQPSGNGVAARNLVRLFEKTKDEKYRTSAEKTIKLFAVVLKTSPTAAPVTADALDRWIDLTHAPTKP